MLVPTHHNMSNTYCLYSSKEPDADALDNSHPNPDLIKDLAEFLQSVPEDPSFWNEHQKKEAESLKEQVIELFTPAMLVALSDIIRRSKEKKIDKSVDRGELSLQLLDFASVKRSNNAKIALDTWKKRETLSPLEFLQNIQTYGSCLWETLPQEINTLQERLRIDVKYHILDDKDKEQNAHTFLNEAAALVNPMQIQQLAKEKQEIIQQRKLERPNGPIGLTIGQIKQQMSEGIIDEETGYQLMQNLRFDAITKTMEEELRLLDTFIHCLNQGRLEGARIELRGIEIALDWLADQGEKAKTTHSKWDCVLQ